jgi:bacteriophage exclusion system BrxA-like protein
MDKAENVGGRALSYVQTVRWTAGKRRHNVFRKLSSTPHSHADVRYRADITAGSLKVAESRRVAELLLKGVDDTAWKRAIVDDNILQARNPESAKRLARLIRARLEPLGPELWRLVRDGKGPVATHAVFAAAIKHSALLGDFLGMAVAEQYRIFAKALSNKLFDDYLEGCRVRDPNMPDWNESTRRRLRSSVFQMLAQAGYLKDTRSLKLLQVHVAEPVLWLLKDRGETYVLRCLAASP